jgi:hypothetical protein
MTETAGPSPGLQGTWFRPRFFLQGAMIHRGLVVQISKDDTTLTIFEINENPHPF